MRSFLPDAGTTFLSCPPAEAVGGSSCRTPAASACVQSLLPKAAPSCTIPATATPSACCSSVSLEDCAALKPPVCSPVAKGHAVGSAHECSVRAIAGPSIAGHVLVSPLECTLRGACGNASRVTEACDTVREGGSPIGTRVNMLGGPKATGEGGNATISARNDMLEGVRTPREACQQQQQVVLLEDIGCDGALSVVLRLLSACLLVGLDSCQQVWEHVLASLTGVHTHMYHAFMHSRCVEPGLTSFHAL
jgi:hypothetical protein